MSAEQRAEQAADNAKPQPMLNGLSRDQFFKLSPEEQNAVRAQADMDNPKTAAFFNALKFVASPVKFLYDKLAPAPAASEMQKYIDAADFESQVLTRDRAYEAYGNSIEGVTASDAATAEAQRVQAEAANLARMQADTNPFGNYYDSSESSRLDVSGYPLRESELRSFERGLAPAPAPAPAPVFTPAPIEGGDVPGAVPLNTSRIMASAKLAGDKPITDSVETYSPFDAVGQYGVGEGNYTKNQIGALITQQESTARDYINAGQTLGFEHPTTVALKESYDSLNNLINAGYNRVLGEQPAAETDKAREARVDAMIAGLPDARQVTPSDMGAVTTALNRSYDLNNPNTNTYGGGFNDVGASTALNPFPGLASDKMSIAGKNVGTYTPGQFRGAYLPDVPGAISADPDVDTDKKAQELGIPSAAEFAAMIGAPFAQTAALNTGVVSDAGIGSTLAGYQGGYNPGYATPNMGYGRGALGTIGGVWRSADGTPVRTWEGSPLMTGAGAEAQAQQDARVAAFDAGRGGGDRNSVTPGGGSRDAAPAPAADRGHGREGQHAPSRDGGEGGGLGEGSGGGRYAATGGLSTPYGFQHMAQGGISSLNQYNLGSYSDGGRLLRGPGDGVSDSIPATIGKGRPARLADGEFVIPARIVSEIGNGSTEAGARKLYAMMDRIQASRRNTVGKGKVAVNNRVDKYLPA
jgi:hypothetical protein